MTRTVVVGLGRSGIGAARLLRAQGKTVTVLERLEGDSQTQRARDLVEQGIEVQLGRPLTLSSFAPWLDDLEAVVVSPGIDWNHPTLDALRQQGVAVIGEMALAWQFLNTTPWIGITGTNGKTTVTQLLQHVLSSGGLHAPMAGNVGHSATELALSLSAAVPNGGDPTAPDWLVMEMSSYQIEAAATVAPRIGIWTTLTPDHLERHGTLEAYRAIKRGLLERSQIRIFNADDSDLSRQRASWDHGLWISAAGAGDGATAADLWCDAEGVVHCRRRGPLFPASALAMPGDHNRQNLLMVTAAALEAGLEPEVIAAALRTFPGVPHRLERLGELKGMQVFNDSKATNFDAAVVALRSVPRPAVVLAGGQTKQGEAGEWLTLMGERSCAVVLYGSGAEELANLLSSNGYPGQIRRCDDLDAAVPIALDLGHQLRAGTLLLSPACASFDQYSDFEARGDHFRTLIATQLST